MYKTIMVHLDESDASVARLDVALALARTHDAHVVGFYPLVDVASVIYMEAPVPSGVYEAQRQAARAQSTKNREAFTEALGRSGASGEWRGVDCEVAAMALIDAAVCADLLVVGLPAGGDDRYGGTGFIGDVLLYSPAPLLLVPAQGGAGAPGRRVAIAWNGSRESARAVAGALPLLARAERIHVVTVAGADAAADAANAKQLAGYLGRHGVHVETVVGRGDDVAEEIIDQAERLDCDLIVAGGYGHSRLREAILGGATRGLLDGATVPLLMAH